MKCDKHSPVRANIKKRFDSVHPEESKEAVLVDNLFRQLDADYVAAYKRGIVDYILMVRQISFI